MRRPDGIVLDSRSKRLPRRESWSELSRGRGLASPASGAMSRYWTKEACPGRQGHRRWGAVAWDASHLHPAL